MDDPKTRQAELDAYAVKRGWQPHHFRTWEAFGFTVKMAAKGWPRPYIASRGDQSREFLDLEDLERYVRFVQITGQEPAERLGSHSVER